MITAVVLSPAVDKIYFVDGFRAGGLYRPEDTVKSAGGKGINVARVAAALGQRVNAVGFKAGDTGSWLVSQLDGLKVNTFFTEVQGESRTNINIIDSELHTETELLERGPHITPADTEAFLEAFKRILERTSVLVCSGGLPHGIPEDFYRTLIEISRSRNIKVILDSSNKMLAEGIKAKPYMVKPNIRELSGYIGRTLETKEDIIGACRLINSQGVEVVTASLGAGGALLVSGDTVLEAVNPAVEAVNTIGSGDSMVAGFASALAENYTLEEAFRLGTACAVANTQFMEIGVVSRDLVRKYRAETIIRRVG
ncbi:fructose-1-phosphate kinase [Anaerobacterium chartisolvens]|uniref:Tagatose-6-phosphate kinase n=1 Tax=Anaerobacterium chartisolvens TaxID=1297424 RepID=A0A369BBL2_9FIRM|nr:1-phosphofructokinase family hexose kinase [Anaerobacterium chartisolvens]RCX18801.1 fructose-1-phosphate kinase [Anaerobacterium chartisolvens]